MNSMKLMRIILPWLSALVTLSACAPSTGDQAALKGNLSPAAFDSILAPHFDQHSPGAVAIVTKRGQVLFRKSYGMANIEQAIPLQADDLLPIGSVTKQFTAAGIVLLAQQGKLDVSDPIARYLPDYPTHGQTITIEHLLTHTSGIRNATDMPGFRENMNTSMSVDELIATFKDEPLQFPPGSKFEYSNSGYLLLGAIIERVSKLPYHEFMARNIFVPLGMTATAVEGYERGSWAARRARVQGYSGGDKAPPLSPTQSYAAGSIVTNVDDLARWDAAISEGRLLTADNWRRMFSPAHLSGGEPAKIRMNEEYGYGWVLFSRAGHPTAGHPGGTPGFTSSVLRIPDERIYVAILTNSGAETIQTFLAAKISGTHPNDYAEKLAEVALANDR